MRPPILFRAVLAMAAVSLTGFLHGADPEVVEMATDTTSAANQLKPMPRQSAAEIAPASDEATAALKRMQLPAGLEAKLWAAEPMLANPVAFNFDERGRIFVAETYRYRTSVLDIRDYMWMLEDDLANRTIADQAAGNLKHFGPEGVKELSIESERVRLLEDTDHDGKADRSTVFAEGFNSQLDGIAAGVLARRGKVWFTNIPSLWRFDGETKAGTAAKRTELSRGYGVRYNFTGHDMHGLILGPDGKLYFSIGDRGAHAKAIDGSVVDSPDTGGVFRCDPDGTHLEIFATGLRNPQSLLFNEYGDLFTGDNDCDTGDEERLVHIVEGGDSGWRIGYQYAPLGNAGMWNLEKLWVPRFKEQAAYLLAPICNIEDGPSGIAYYPGTGLNHDYQGSIFITHFKGSIAKSGIYTYNVKPSGASYAIEDCKPFLVAALPTDVKFGPDGKLYYSDWAEGWPKSRKGRIYAISDPAHVNDPLVKETQKIIASDFTKKTSNDLFRLLQHADWRVRLEAQYTLAERGDPAVFARMLAKADAPVYAHLHAIWGLGQLAEKNAAALTLLRGYVKALDSMHPEVRAQAAKLMGDHHVVDQTDALIAALSDKNARVKFFAAQSLGKLKQASATPALLAALRANNDEDDYLRHALVMGLVGGDDLAALTAAVTDESRAVRLGVLLALRRLGRPEVARFLADPDPLLVAEAARAINDVPINEAQPALAAFIAKPTADENFMLRVLNANFRLGTPAHAAALATYAARADASEKLRAEALAQLAAWPKPLARDRIVGIYRPLTPATRDASVAANALAPSVAALLAVGSPSAVQMAALAAVEKLEIHSVADALYAIVGDEQSSASTRAAALGVLAHFKDARLATAVQQAGESNSSRLRLAALPIAANLSPDAAAPILVHLAAHGNVAEQKAAFKILGTLKHPSADAFLADELRLLAQGQVVPAVQLELVEAAAQREDPAVKQLVADRAAQLQKTGDELALFRIALVGGDAERGKKLFLEHPVLACVRCHKAGTDGGGDAGPNLGAVGAEHPREYLLQSIVKPSAKIALGFETATVTLKAGGVHAGTVTAEDDTSLTLQLPDKTVEKLAKTDIAKRDTAPSSMPEIFGQILSKSELRDLVEFLSTLTTKDERAEPEAVPRALRNRTAKQP